MMLSKKCQECTHANTIGDCEGKTKEELQRIPCGKWKFDMTLLDESVDEPEQQEQTQDETTIDEELNQQQDGPSKINQLVCPELVVDEENQINQTEYRNNETPTDKFRRISAKRLKRTLYDLKLLAQFGRLYRQYEWTQAQADEIVEVLQKGIDIVKHKLTDKAIK